jgi:hypothetical protein
MTKPQLVLERNIDLKIIIIGESAKAWRVAVSSVGYLSKRFGNT